MQNKEEISYWCKQGTPVWVEIKDKTQDEVLEYLEANVHSIDEQTTKVLVTFPNQPSSQNNPQSYNPSQILPRTSTPEIVNNLAMIQNLNDAELLKHLELRYKKNLIHCFCGPTLIVVNPYIRIVHEESFETKWKIVKKLEENKLDECFPHLWTIAARCYYNLFKTGQNQAICISGESGAGKTESTKRCMAFIAQLQYKRKSVVQVPIEEKILRSNPLLEAFGNAKTFKNDNSSRFGKYTIMYLYKNNKKVKGAAIEKYLLEKSRVCITNQDERNFHIFYALCRFAPVEKLKKLRLINDDGVCNMKKFNYLNQSGVYTSSKVNDEEVYNDVLKSLNDLEFSKEEQEGIWKTLAAVLHLGNLSILDISYEEGAKPCTIEKNESWKNLCYLLEFDPLMFEESLTFKELRVGMNVTKSPFSLKQCKNNIDSIAKEIYDRMFEWIILKLNKTLKPSRKEREQCGTIGMLDIFGFEIFEKNSIEQFFINYANEKLQSLYIEYIFKNECKIFEEEGLSEYTSLIVYKDNKPIVLALDNNKLPPGVFNLIDQSCLLNKNDEYLHAEIKKAHKTSQCITFPRFSNELSFIVIHTARAVEYITDTFVEKNKDKLSNFLRKAFQTSNSTIVDIFDGVQGLEISTIQEESPVNPKEKYLGYKFRRDMNHLISELVKTHCQFVRCVKPNEFKKDQMWNAHLVLLQIRYMGMLDSLKIRKLSYPFRFYYSEFFKIYQDLLLGENLQFVNNSSLLLDQKINTNITEQALKPFKKLQNQNADFKTLSMIMSQNCKIENTDKDLLYGAKRIFLNEKFKINLDKALMVKQQQKRTALNSIAKLYKEYLDKQKINNYMKTKAKGILLARDLLKSWSAKVEGFKFKKYVRLVRKIQIKFRIVKEKRHQRFMLFNAKMLCKWLSLQKFEKIVSKIQNYTRKVKVLQAMLNRKIIDAQNRHCSQIVNRVFEKSWNIINEGIQQKSILYIQNTFRGLKLRQQKKIEYEVLQQKIDQRDVFVNTSIIQKYIRGELVRSRMDRLNRAAYKIQGHFRTKWMQAYLKKLLVSVKIIQRFMQKCYIRQVEIKQNWKAFYEIYGDYIFNLADIEYRILFSNEDLVNQSNFEDFEKLPIFVENLEMQMENLHRGFKAFIPETPQIELHPKTKLVNVLLDFHMELDTTDVYPKTWAYEFLNFLNMIHSKGKRLLKLEIGESTTFALTDDKELYSWGLNDYHQCARSNSKFVVSQRKVKNLSANKAKCYSIGRNHGVFIDEGNSVYVFGDNQQGQLGLGHQNWSPNITILEKFKDNVSGIVCEGNRTFLVTESGNVFAWPEIVEKKEEVQEENVVNFKNGNHHKNGIDNLESKNGFSNSRKMKTTGKMKIKKNNHKAVTSNIENELEENQFFEFSPQLLEMKHPIKQVVCGTNFTMLLSKTGILYSFGENRFGELGLNHKKSILTPEIIPLFQDQNEKVIEVSCGSKHVISRTFLNRIFVWGLNSSGQLGLGDIQSRISPTLMTIPHYGKMRFKVRSVQAGLFASFILLDDRKMYYSGKIGREQGNSIAIPQKFSYEEEVFKKGQRQNFQPVKLECKWSKMMQVVSIIFADFRNCGVQAARKEKVVEKINQVWAEKPDLVLPVQNEILHQFLDFRYFMNDKIQIKPNLSYAKEFDFTQTNIIPPMITQTALTDTCEAKLEGYDNNLQQNMKKNKGDNLKNKKFNKKQGKRKTPLNSKTKNQLKMNKTKKAKQYKMDMGSQNDIDLHVADLKKKNKKKLTLQEKNLIKLYDKLHK